MGLQRKNQSEIGSGRRVEGKGANRCHQTWLWGMAGDATGHGLAKSVVPMGSSAGCMVKCVVLQRSRSRDVGPPLFFTGGT